ncbi:MAG: MFS transporter [Bilophila wadsworthia]
MAAHVLQCPLRLEGRPGRSLRLAGSLFYTLAVSLLSIGAIWLFSGAWAGVLFALGVVFLGLFLWEERRSHHPILDVAFLVKNKAFALSTLASFINYSSIFGVTFYFSLYLQGVHGLTLLETGLLLSAQPAVQVFISPLGGRMADRHGADIIATIGIAVCGVGLLLASSLDGRRRWVVTLVQLVIGSHRCSRLNTSAIMTVRTKRTWGGFGAGGTACRSGRCRAWSSFPDHERLSGRRGARPEQYS